MDYCGLFETCIRQEGLDGRRMAQLVAAEDGPEQLAALAMQHLPQPNSRAVHDTVRQLAGIILQKWGERHGCPSIHRAEMDE